MKISEIMTTEIETAEMDTTIEEIASMMRDANVGAIPVVDEEELAGIITDRDIVTRCIAEGMDPAETTVEDVLTESIHTVSPDDDVRQAQRIMSEHQIRRLPVVEDGRLVGMLSIGDIAVKHGDDEEIGDTLEAVSEGVKKSPAKKGVAKSAKKPGGMLSSMMGKLRGGGATANKGSAPARKPGTRGGGRQATIEQQGGRRKASTEGRSRIDESRGDLARGIETGGSRARQGIANRSPREENARQAKVVGKAAGKKAGRSGR